MKHTIEREEIEKKNYVVFLQKEDDIKPRRVRFPQSVNLTDGEVQMWVPVIPGTTEQEKRGGILRDDLEDVQSGTDLASLKQPEEIETEAILKTEKGKVFVMNQNGSYVQKSK